MPRQARPRKRPDSPYWWITVPHPDTGRSIRVSAGTTDFQEALALQRRANQQRFESVKFGKAPDRLIDDALLRYIEDNRSRMSESTLERIGWAGKRIAEAWSGRTIQSLTPDDVAAYKRARARGELGTSPVGPATIAKELNLVSSAIKHCNHEYAWNLPNVLTGRIPKPDNARERWLTPDEAMRLLEVAKTRKRAPWLYDIIRLALNTGMRPGEVLRLKVSQIDEVHCCVRFGRRASKNREGAMVPLNDEAWDAIQSRLQWQRDRNLRSQWLFCSWKGEQIKSIKTAWRLLLVEAQIADFKRHDMRHTAASWLAQQGYSLPKIGRLLRHKDPRSTARYAHLRNDDAIELAASLRSFTTRPKQGDEGDVSSSS